MATLAPFSAPAVGVDVLAQRLVVTCARFSRSVSRVTAGESTAVWRTLAVLDEHGALRIRDLANLNQCTQPSATGMVQRLEAEGDVVRVSDDTDGRATLVTLSAGGRDHLRRLRADASTLLAPALSSLSRTQLDQLDGALETISELTNARCAVSGDRAGAVDTALR